MVFLIGRPHALKLSQDKLISTECQYCEPCTNIIQLDSKQDCGFVPYVALKETARTPSTETVLYKNILIKICEVALLNKA